MFFAALRQRRLRLCEFGETEGVDHQRLRHWRRVRHRPIGPVLTNGEAAKIRMAHTQCRYARNRSELQDNKLLATERVKRMRDLNRSQRLAGSKCSSMRSWQPRAGVVDRPAWVCIRAGSVVPDTLLVGPGHAGPRACARGLLRSPSTSLDRRQARRHL